MLPIIELFFLLFIPKNISANGASDMALSEYYPIGAALKWEYSMQENNKAFLQEVICTIPSDSQFILYTKSTRQTQYFFHIREGVVILSQIQVKLPFLPFDFTIRVKPGLPIFYFGKSPGDSWDWNGNFSSFLAQKQASIHTEICGIDTLLINNKFSECLRIVSQINMDGKKDTLTAWYAVGIGLVKQSSRRQKKYLTGFCHHDNDDPKFAEMKHSGGQLGNIFKRAGAKTLQLYFK